MSMDKEQIRRVVSQVVHERLGEEAGRAPARPAASRWDDDPAGARRELITEDDVMAAHQTGRELVIGPRALVTPLARDAIDRYRVPVSAGRDQPAAVESVRRAAGAAEQSCKKGSIAIGCDHGGFEMKQLLVSFLAEEAGIPCEDLGTHSAESVDYPDFARKVAEAVASGRCCRGIIVDGAGIGSAMAANKVKGVRAAHCSNVVEARNAREHNDANVLSLGGRMIGPEVAKAIAVVFMKTDFAGGRHQGRVDKIMRLER